MTTTLREAPLMPSGCGPIGIEPWTDPATRERRMRTLYAANAATLRRYLMHLTHGRTEAAEDLLQETMLRAWRRVDRLPAGAQSQRRWLFTVARNLAVDAARARRSRPLEVSGEDIALIPDIDGVLDGLLDRQVLNAALRRLSPEHREVLVNLYYRDASVAEVAAGIGVPEGTVRSRSFYALRALRDVLGRPEPDGPR